MIARRLLLRWLSSAWNAPQILLHHADELQAVSCDEALLDVSSKMAESGQGQEEALAQQIRQEIREATGCEASIGISGNIMLARMATKQAKPCGQYFLKSDEVQGFLRGKSVRELPGVGWSLEQRLMDKGIILISDLQQKSKSELQKSFGPKTGTTLYEFSRGIDERPLVVATPRQSIGADVAWGVRFDDNAQVEVGVVLPATAYRIMRGSAHTKRQKFVNDLAAEVARRMKAVGGGEGTRARCITLKIKIRAANAPKEPPKFLGCGECDSYSKSVKLVHATGDAEVIGRECNIMIKQFNFDPTDIRGNKRNCRIYRSISEWSLTQKSHCQVLAFK
ncbi:MAG: hypothetical protein BJ554DRAFT_6970 [Olpidium bornovanus]|uniref:UmuC domain-containing protein n=1 Tax=Olpidium bornovanus TaxID=278681 RepID=A0A8H8DJT3_9FUNG|nr:MAG: hypothetical protein BJ554DRAFT_6970 [Olpidium bornovanus]